MTPDRLKEAIAESRGALTGKIEETAKKVAESSVGVTSEAFSIGSYSISGN